MLIKPNRLFFIPHLKSVSCPQKLFIDGITLERERVTTFFGVIIDENATWKVHINTISTNISKSIKARLIIPRKHLNQL